MNILFCGTWVPEIIEYRIKNISAAGNRFQNNMICNLKALGHEVDVISYISIEIPEELKIEFLDGGSSNRDNIIKHFCILRENGGSMATLQSVKKCKKTVRELISKYDVILCYNVFYSFFFLPKMAKRFQKKNILILADYSGVESYHSIKNKLYAGMQMWVMRQYDMVVGLSANIQKKIKPDQQFLLMEGGIDENFYNRFSEKSSRNKEKVIFMYSGLLSKVTGVDILLQAVTEINEKGFELWISGKGYLEQQVCEASKRDNRICYLGHMEYNEYIETLKKVDVLINPRNMSLPENQNNFPSKIMDYLATGKDILSSKFVGWEKFDENIIFYDDENMLKDEMEKYICGRYIIGENYKKNRKLAIDFLWKNQLKRIFGDEL